MDFDKAYAARRTGTWEEALGRHPRRGRPASDDRVKFYTGLFHALLGRGLASDVNGAYPANDGTVGQIPLDGEGQTAAPPLQYRCDLGSLLEPHAVVEHRLSRILCRLGGEPAAGLQGCRVARRRHRMQQVRLGRGHQLHGARHRCGLQLRYPQLRRGAGL